MSPQEFQLYQRQLLLPEIGIAGQRRLRDLSVLVVGVGGLGCPAAIYLATSGVGRIGLVDGDKVEISNLHRQTLYNFADVGKPKTQAAAAHLAQLNPFIKLEQHDEPLTEANAEKLISSYDIILEGSDNFTAKYLVNWWCVRLKKPFVLASVMRSQGQLLMHEPGSACYGCLFPEAPPAELAPNCADAGVLGVVPGIIGLFQAAELLKFVLKFGESPVGQLRVFDMNSLRLDSFTVPKNPECAVCAGTAAPAASEFCATARDSDSLSARELKSLLESGSPPVLLDVRSPQEFTEGSIGGASNTDWELFRAGSHDKNLTYAVYCLKGMRSRKFIDRMKAEGYSNVRHLKGGILAWLMEFGDG